MVKRKKFNFYKKADKGALNSRNFQPIVTEVVGQSSNDTSF